MEQGFGRFDRSRAVDGSEERLVGPVAPVGAPWRRGSRSHDGGHADELTLHLSNYDGQLVKPKKGAKLNVSLGFIETGVGAAGSFEVQTVTKLGATAAFEVTAHSTNLNKSWKKQKARSWKPPTTLGQVLDEVAGDNGCTAAVSDALRDVTIDKIIAQHGDPGHPNLRQHATLRIKIRSCRPLPNPDISFATDTWNRVG